MRCFDKPSPNFDDRKGEKPELIVLHYTAMQTAEEALDRLTDPAAKVSCHYLIDEKGNIWQLVDEDKRAWHAGISSWQGKDDVNSRSIGIEIANNGTDPYTKEQLFSLTLLCKDLMFRHKIKPENIIGHSDVAPDRKQDPGAHFPWALLARHGIGRVPEATLADKFNAAAVAKDRKQLRQLFNDAGYGVNAFGKNKPTLRQLTLAFQRHYQPEVFTRKNRRPGKITPSTVAKLRALARQNKKSPPPPAA
jgi:N-acetylmuramoyl-L-alanine amidase